MDNSLMDEPRYDGLNQPKLNPEQIIRCNRDLTTINSIDRFTMGIRGAVPIVTAGYATEAHCGGVITRHHEDIDMHITSLPVKERTGFIRGLEGLLRREQDHANWTLYQSNDFGWAQAVEFREDAPEKA